MTMNLQKLPKKINQLKVLVNKQKLGLLTHSSIYNYQPTQTDVFVSLTMERKNLDSYLSGALHPIFSQNLPEGFTRRFISERLARYAKVDDIYLLALQGELGIGMLAYESEFSLPTIENLELSEILRYKGTEPLFPQLLEKYYLRNALSGVQPKVSIPNTKVAIEQKDLIVKTYDEEFPLLTVNEFVCMQAAEYCGLNPPKTYLSENLENFVIERFDSFDGISPEPQLLGYEDFTTLLKKPNSPNAKYTGAYETLLKATYIYTKSLQAVETIYSYIVFNCLIGNGDAHLKNFALQYTPNRSRVFASPPFDITHTLIYKSIDDKMALNMAKSKDFPDKSTLIKLANSTHFRIRNAEEIIDKLAEGILDYLKKSAEVELFVGLKSSIEKSVANVMLRDSIKKPYRHNKKKKFK